MSLCVLAYPFVPAGYSRATLESDPVRATALRRRLRVELHQVRDLLTQIPLQDELTLKIREWYHQFSEDFTHKMDERPLSNCYIRRLQETLVDPVFHAPLDEQPLLASDGRTYSKMALEMSQEGSNLAICAHPIAEPMIQWLKSHNALLKSEALERNYLEYRLRQIDFTLQQREEITAKYKQKTEKRKIKLRAEFEELYITAEKPIRKVMQQIQEDDKRISAVLQATEQHDKEKTAEVFANIQQLESENRDQISQTEVVSLQVEESALQIAEGSKDIVKLEEADVEIAQEVRKLKKTQEPTFVEKAVAVATVAAGTFGLSEFVPGVSVESEIDLRDPLNSSIAVSSQLSESINGLMQVTPLNPKELTIGLDHDIDMGEDEGSVSVGLLLNPFRPKDVKIPVVVTDVVKDFSGSLVINPKAPHKSVVSISGKSESYQGSISVPLNKPLESRITGKVPVGDGVMVGFDLLIRKPQDVRISLEVSLHSLDKIIGIKLPIPSSITLLKLDRKSVAKNAKVVGKVVKKVLRKVFGRRKRKKHKPVVYFHQFSLDMNHIDKMHKALEQLFDQLTEIAKLAANDSAINAYEKVLILLQSQNGMLTEVLKSFHKELEMMSVANFDKEMEAIEQANVELGEKTEEFKKEAKAYQITASKRTLINQQLAAAKATFASDASRFRNVQENATLMMNRNVLAMKDLLEKI